MAPERKQILICPDKFKGSLSARQAAGRLADGWRAVWPQASMTLHPVADGGDGTLDAIAACSPGKWMTVRARDARGRQGNVTWWHDDGKAWIEVARICGLAALAKHELDPLTATSTGLGDTLTAARHSGANRVFVCLGGSATNDAGCGMAHALGFKFYDKQGCSFQPQPAGLSRLERIEPPPEPFGIEVIGLTDVQNPLLGPEGASRIYGPQKGASAEDVERLEETLTCVATIAARDLGAPDPATPGAGAAGGLGYGVMTFLGGSLRPGFDTVAAITGLPAALAAADLVLTGEGRIDEQTAEGKAPAGVARLARAAGKPVIAFGGSVSLTRNLELFDAVIPIANGPMTLEESIQQAGPLLHAAAARTARLLQLGKILSPKPD